MPRRESRSSKQTPPTSKSAKPDTKPPPAGIAEPAKPTTSVAGAPAPGSGLLSQMAATAGGVAIGSVLGRALGGFFERSEVTEQKPETNEVEKKAATPVDTRVEKGSAEDVTCTVEMQQFLSCADRAVDLKICEGFKEALQQCKKASGRTSPFYEA
uniref:CHCH domain-containing protein n=1 Tax=Anopheles dirus TaxID=7168 RepID=A0A182NHQ9_9DIPT